MCIVFIVARSCTVREYICRTPSNVFMCWRCVRCDCDEWYVRSISRQRTSFQFNERKKQLEEETPFDSCWYYLLPKRTTVPIQMIWTEKPMKRTKKYTKNSHFAICTDTKFSFPHSLWAPCRHQINIYCLSEFFFFCCCCSALCRVQRERETRKKICSRMQNEQNNVATKWRLLLIGISLFVFFRRFLTHKPIILGSVSVVTCEAGVQYW